MITNLKNRVELWEKNGVIDRPTSERIIEFERSKNSRPWVVFGIAGIGITALISGIISIVAANWAEISTPVKIAAYFALQLGAGALFLKHERSEGLWREVSLAVFALIFWAGIGLFSQVYNLKGETWQAILLWAALALPATLYAQSRMLCSLWCIALLCAVGFWASDYRVSSWSTSFARGCIAATAPVLLSSLAIFGHYHGLIRDQLRRAAIQWGIGSIMLIGVPLANTWWDSPSYRYIAREPLGQNVWFILIPWGAVAWAILVSLSRPSLSAALRSSSAAMFLAAATYLTIPALCDVSYLFPKPLNQVLGAVGFLVVWGLAATAAALASMKRLFDFASFVIALRFVIIYFEVFGSLTTTGIGLIISGGVIITIAIYWNKLRALVTKRLIGGV
jgi:uncharacterized membrane protein